MISWNKKKKSQKNETLPQGDFSKCFKLNFKVDHLEIGLSV